MKLYRLKGKDEYKDLYFPSYFHKWIRVFLVKIKCKLRLYRVKHGTVLDWNDFGESKMDIEYDVVLDTKYKILDLELKMEHGELVRIKMQGGRVAIYQLLSRNYNTVFDNTGQNDWRFLFLKYE